MLARTLLPLLLLTLLGPTATARPDTARIDRWILQLGSPSYLVRLRAERRLRLQGPAATGRLKKAFTHPDLQIRRAARRLVDRALCHQWVAVRPHVSIRSQLRSSIAPVRIGHHACKRCGKVRLPAQARLQLDQQQGQFFGRRKQVLKVLIRN